MKTFLLKSTAFSLILSFSLLITYILVRGWNGLQATDGDTLTASKWNELVSSSSSAPSGAVMAFNLSTCPAGRKPADGTNGTPDLRGQFLRGLNSFDGGISIRVDGKQDPDGLNRILGEWQEDKFKSHEHDMRVKNSSGVDGRGIVPELYKYHLNIGYSELTGGTETRPKNVAVIFCIKE